MGAMRAPKILAVASAADLDFRYGCTPAWWQLWRALAEAGADLIVTTYRGRAIESPWWRSVPNPLYREAELYAAGRGVAARLSRQEFVRRPEHEPGDTAGDRAVRAAIWRYVTPRWQRHLERTIEREGGVDAVVVFTVPMAHFRGIPTAIRERFDVPVVYYDGDLPMSLPEYGGTDTSGFNYYVGADPGEYDLVIGNSEGALDRVRELGARRAEAVHWAADPELFHPREAVLAHVDSQEIKQVVLNLIVNALESMDAQGSLRIEARYHQGMAEMIFLDDGCGMEPEVLENIFEPFFTKRREGKGTGLGLSITHRIVSQHHGEIMASSPGEGKGSMFKVRLPIHPSDIDDISELRNGTNDQKSELVSASAAEAHGVS